MNNLEFMKHLHLHVDTERDEAIDMADLSQCRYCYKDFDSEEKANSHVELEHLKTGQEFVCQICSNSYPAKHQLVMHMTKVHVKLEMPYQCQVCGPRTSLHRDLLEHLSRSRGLAPVSSDQALTLSQQAGCALYVETSARYYSTPWTYN